MKLKETEVFLKMAENLTNCFLNNSSHGNPFLKEMNCLANKQDFSNNSSSESFHKDSFDVQGLWVVGWLTLLEYAVLWLKGKPLPLPHENMLSMCHAILYELGRLALRTFGYGVYTKVWDNSFCSHLFSDSILSFLFTAILIDFGYYWLHRLSHEVMLLWAVHQVHHSSEEITISVSLRHSPLHYCFVWVFYLPFAYFGVPPFQVMAHIQFSFLYQAWLHTCAVDSMGPLERILNTPSHHRVHHGSIKYCLDTNYGGILIIWDHLFGTFRKERPNERIIYGLVLQPVFWNPLHHQIFYLKYMIEKARSTSNWKDTLNTIWKGSMWQPGLSRLGRELELPCDSSKRKIATANTSLIINCYVFAHLIASMILMSIVTQHLHMSGYVTCTYSLFLVAAVTNIGIIYEGNSTARLVEICRCIFGSLMMLFLPLGDGFKQTLFISLFSFSLVFWLLFQTQNKVQNEDKKKN